MRDRGIEPRRRSYPSIKVTHRCRCGAYRTRRLEPVFYVARLSRLSRWCFPACLLNTTFRAQFTVADWWRAFPVQQRIALQAGSELVQPPVHAPGSCVCAPPPLQIPRAGAQGFGGSRAAGVRQVSLAIRPLGAPFAPFCPAGLAGAPCALGRILNVLPGSHRRASNRMGWRGAGGPASCRNFILRLVPLAGLEPAMPTGVLALAYSGIYPTPGATSCRANPGPAAPCGRGEGKKVVGGGRPRSYGSTEIGLKNDNFQSSRPLFLATSSKKERCHL